LLLSLVFPLAQVAKGAGGTWKVNADGLWSTAGNWKAGVPEGTDSLAAFDAVTITADRTVSLDTPRTVGGLVFGASSPASAGSWILSNNGTPANVLTLDVSSGTPTITVNMRDTVKTATISAVIDGRDGLTKEGPGTLVLSGANSFTGGLGINAGEVRLGSSNDSGLGATGGAVSLGNHAVLRSSTDTTHTLGAGRVLTVDTGGGTLAASGYSPRTFAFDIQGSGLLSLAAGTTQINLTGRNQSHAGGVEIVSGRVQFFNALALPSAGDVAIAPAGGLIAAGAHGDVNAWLAGGRIAAGSAGAILLAGPSIEAVSMKGYASLMMGAGVDNAAFTGTLAPAGGDYRLGGGGQNGITPRLVIAGTNSLTGARGLIVGNGTAGTTSVGISAPQDFTGGTTVTQGARLIVRHSRALGSGLVNNVNGEVLLSGGVTVANALQLTSVVDSINIEESLRSSAGDNTWSGDVTLLARTRFYANNVAGNRLTVTGNVNVGTSHLGVITGGSAGGDIVIRGDIRGTGGLSKGDTAGTLTLTGANVYGSTTIKGGMLRIGDGGRTGTLGTGGVSINDTNGGALVFNRTNTYVVANVISGAGAVIQQGTGVTILAGFNTCTGPTSIKAGTLLVNGALSEFSEVTVSRGGRLGGLGRVGAVTFDAGAAFVCDITDVTQAGGGLTAARLTGAGLDRFTVFLTGAAAGFDGTKDYTWPVLTSSSVAGIALGNVTLDTTGFARAFTGRFTLSKEGNTLRVTYAGATSPASIASR
jgi:fibronectin-binding autotransporter adhesin